ncbi:6-phosphogluconolactonase [Marinovum sp. 2_MG-2023]|uniref:6-phosphogluconolactonase n=1 Tax=unclassified Marinovum TaxID=2647166 RepID=UPI0026E3C5F3|nr:MULTISPECIES: 6-phosphogluconolactonase [unclassified Marinovum]MDO6730512.1 6-phosphogluconolactonase [Marinovum sp. 2_MG-2023]MDO6778492.1 6-phosphogluconolactonase [Marinovum sp. 1_MG-2023]
MEFIEYADREMLVIDLANKLAGELRSALQHQDRVLMAVPGGTTPGPIFDDLCAADLDWSRVDVMLSDERWVPEDSERSNTRLLRERLLVDRAAAATLLPMYLPSDTPEDRLAELEALITPRLPVQVLLLGMGADMHTASLFPGADQLEGALSPKAPILMAMRAPGAPEPRVTLTAPVLDGAMSKHIVIFGDEKRTALNRARQLSPKDAPVAAVLSEAQVHWAP